MSPLVVKLLICQVKIIDSGLAGLGSGLTKLRPLQAAKKGRKNETDFYLTSCV
jgi:hypothetical protein